jgi:glycosyltransferase involved in cell wall biosynthesis
MGIHKLSWYRLPLECSRFTLKESSLRQIHYISPSVLPSKSANSVHVVLQCEALSKVGCKVVLYFKRKTSEKSKVAKQIAEAYGVDIFECGIQLKSYHTHHDKAVNLHIALLAAGHLFRNIIKRKTCTYVLSRNLYASFILGVIFRMPLLFETHQLEYGFRKYIQKVLLKSTRIKTIVISEKLSKYLQKHHQCSIQNYLVMHDAASMPPFKTIGSTDKKKHLGRILPGVKTGQWKSIAGYFGHVYEGRGINIIIKMAEKRPDVLFTVVGGNQNDIRKRKNEIKSENIFFLGHVPHPDARLLMQMVDVLLMPYQKTVSIGIARHDTAKWMSPMKMFEYMASDVPLIASDLPVLREILEDGKNALLVPPDNVDSWTHALDIINEDRNLALSFAKRAKSDFISKHTWSRRAEMIIKAFG